MTSEQEQSYEKKCEEVFKKYKYFCVIAQYNVIMLALCNTNAISKEWYTILINKSSRASHQILKILLINESYINDV